MVESLNSALAEIEASNYDQAEYHLNKAQQRYRYLDDYLMMSQESLREQKIATATVETHIESSKAEKRQLGETLNHFEKILQNKKQNAQRGKNKRNNEWITPKRSSQDREIDF